MRYLYNPRDLKSKKPFGAVPENKKIDLCFDAIDGVFVYEVHIVLTKDSNKEVIKERLKFSGKTKNGDEVISHFKKTISLEEKGIYWYHFELKTEVGDFDLYRDDNGYLSDKSEREYQITVYDKDYKVPDFLKGHNAYQIFVDRFFRSAKAPKFQKEGVFKNWDEEITIFDVHGVRRANDFYGGDFLGIKEKLDYLKKLDVKLIYLTPIFLSPSNHRYDISNYLVLDELLGDEKSFGQLVRAAAANGMKIILDGVFNHTGADSLYFNKFNNFESLGAYQSQDSQFYNWYTFNKFPDDYECWWGVTISPSIKKDNENYQNFIAGDGGVLEKWGKSKIGGWRLDVVDELSTEFVKKIRKRIKKADNNALMIGEVWEDASNKMSYGSRREYFCGDQLDSVMNYVFRDAILEYTKGNMCPSTFANKVMDVTENYPKMSMDSSLTLLSSHDTWRPINYLATRDVSNLSLAKRKAEFLTTKEYLDAKRKLKMAVFMQFTLPGVPMIYYGDEIGMEGYDDPINRRPFTWNNIDEDLLSFYKKLAKMRKKYIHHFKGNFRVVSTDGILVYERNSARRKALIYVNNTNNEVVIQNKGFVKCIYGDVDLKEKEIKIKPGEYIILQKIKSQKNFW